jgi:hypothetical protein
MNTGYNPLALSHLPLPAADPVLLGALLQPRLALFWGMQTPTRALLSMLTTLAARDHNLPKERQCDVRVFDGGNRFDGYFVARLARRLCQGTTGHAADPRAVLNRIRLSRAFTCFQLAELIENAPAGPEPLFVLDLLTTFYDESVPLRDSERLLATTASHLKRLATVGPVIVGAREPRALVKERWALLDRLQIASDVTWFLRSPEDAPTAQPPLF